MSNQTEMKIIEVINEFIIYMLTENDKEKVIYSKLIELEDEELQEWVNEKLKGYLTDGWGYGIEEEEEDIVEPYEFTDWFNDNQKDEYSIFEDCFDLMNIQRKLIDFYDENIHSNFLKNYGEYKEWVNKILQDFYYMIIWKMYSIELKEYIINLLDPVEPK
jgi:hypothetical protein